ncbi:DUF4041 domain-containing protein [Streptomyces murinus]|uniref:DUF4041 domain-containing protein n=1 Tax=Streptomyces murinus TaxID=33900 RepID=UPI000A1E4346|nr:DUF4041 domain-containing protein [Streptomyces murinus]WDO07457.1 DUF4041 domain-containing protein [Streptomyces murinus]
MSAYRFNPPPGWPVPPAGWTPPADWRPDPSWPAAPEGWQLWIPEGGPAPGTPAVGPAPGTPAAGPTTGTLVAGPAPGAPVAGAATGALAVGPTPGAPVGGAVPAVPAPRKGRLFGRRRAEAVSEAEELRAWIARTQGLDAERVADLVRQVEAEAAALRERAVAEAGAEAREIVEDARETAKEILADAREAARTTERLRTEADRQHADVSAAERRLGELQALIVNADETALLQEAGIYAYRHVLQDAIAYRSRLDTLRDEIKSLTRAGRAVHAATDWTVNGSKREGQKMVRDFSKLMLRAYNAEADYAVRSMRPYRLTSLVDRLYKSRETIAKLGATMHIRISDEFHNARVRELELTADYLQKKDEEKEAQREARAREREEAAVQRELDRQREKLNKELGHYQAALERLRERGDAGGAAELEAKLAEIENSLQDVESRAANVRTGYVYVISNIGAFGDRIVKIGMTRRLEPLERVYELSGAAVPFRFDVHALIFSKDAVGLEAELHRHFASQRVNQVNSRKEFFYATPVEVRDALHRFAGQHLIEFTEEPQALEWRASRNGEAGGTGRSGGALTR